MGDEKLSKIAKEVVKIEIESLKKLQSSINKNFEKIIKTIINCKNGKIFINWYSIFFLRCFEC